MLPLDMAILQMMVPGVMRQQDQRTTARMLSALTRVGNLYYKVFEALDSLLVSEKDRLASWWEYNLSTEFFAHKASARLMRLSGLSTRGTGLMLSTPSGECSDAKAVSATPSRA
jgi:hypothetical protein